MLYVIIPKKSGGLRGYWLFLGSLAVAKIAILLNKTNKANRFENEHKLYYVTINYPPYYQAFFLITPIFLLVSLVESIHQSLKDVGYSNFMSLLIP